MNMLFMARPFGVTATVTISITALSCFLFESSFFLKNTLVFWLMWNCC